MTFDISFSSSLWFWLLAVIVMVIFSRWIYALTIPPVSSALRRFLLALRIFTLAAILLLFFEPELTLIRTYSEKPLVAVLVDHSSSMQLRDGPETRAQQVINVLQQPWREELVRRADVIQAAFADTLGFLPEHFSPDSLQFDRDGTDITSALTETYEAVREGNFSAVLLLSDGAHNLGDDPSARLADYPVPVFPVPFGRHDPPQDIWIDDVILNDVAFAGTQVPAEVIVRSTGFAGKRVELSISTGDETVRRRLVLPADLAESRQVVHFTPKAPGLQKITVALSELPGEVTGKNNRRVLYQKILKSKLKVVVVAGAPSADVGFLLQTLRQDDKISVEAFQALAPGVLKPARLPEEERLQEVDCIIAVNPVSAARPDAKLLDWLNEAVVQQEKPVLIITGPVAGGQQGLERMKKLAEVLSLRPSASEQMISVMPTAQGLLHPVLQSGGETTLAQWADLPPVFSTFREIVPAPHVQVLAEAKLSGRESKPVPFLTASRAGKRRTITVFAAGLWRWHLMMKNIEPENSLYSDIVLNAVRWLVSAEDSKLLRIKMPDEVVRAGETIPFTVQAYFEDFRPRDNLHVTLTLISEGEPRSISLQGAGNGLYRGTMQVIGEGDYRVLARAEAGGQRVAADTLAFSVVPFQLEFRDTRANPALLRSIARQSGGRLVHADSLQQWLQEQDFSPRIVREERSYALWRVWPVLALLVLTLSIEWFIRKKKGML